ncbi:MAG: hypothetical protein GTN62_07550 [Gemmatimonadales bacterium]|nr:hypothetical protein [Gemmatimonadales bacterium]NIN11345.1 hypothetical protein [Gemmatimonadales bacterium]NIN49955.1 hypothetical protein [Gemmatimonadales bacterium]NIP07419.1 hypothetical protein [Gemmatimonadales bacterium]NIR00486.1 hypothetical protein [Gemmatimonadales bacterium]
MKLTGRMYLGPLLSSLLLLGTACTQQPANWLPESRVSEAVLQELDAYYRDFSARDWEAFASHFWPGANITTASQSPGTDSVSVMAQSVADFIAQAPQGPGSREIFEEWMIEADVKVFHNLAQAWVRYGARFGDPGDIMEWEGIDAFTLMEVGGDWKISALVFTSAEEGPDLES